MDDFIFTCDIVVYFLSDLVLSCERIISCDGFNGIHSISCFCNTFMAW